MSKYLITLLEQGKPVPGVSMTVQYDGEEPHFLTSWIVEGKWPVELWRTIWKTPPVSEKGLSALVIAASSYIKVEEIAADLSFGRFWEEFGNKVGNKTAVEKKWNELTNDEKVAVFKAIPRYHRHMTITNCFQAMPATWLNGRRWEDSYSTKPKIQR